MTRNATKTKSQEASRLVEDPRAAPSTACSWTAHPVASRRASDRPPELRRSSWPLVWADRRGRRSLAAPLRTYAINPKPSLLCAVGKERHSDSALVRVRELRGSVKALSIVALEPSDLLGCKRTAHFGHLFSMRHPLYLDVSLLLAAIPSGSHFEVPYEGPYP